MGNSRHDLSIPKDYFMKDKAKLLYVSSSTYGGDWISTPHTHYCSELFYVLDGVGQFQVEDRIFPVSANDLVIINPIQSLAFMQIHLNISSWGLKTWSCPSQMKGKISVSSAFGRSKKR